MFGNTSDALKSSADVLEKWNSTGNNSLWRSLDMQKVNTSDGRLVYKLVVEEGFFSYLKNHVKCFLLASRYKKAMEEALQAPTIEKSIKERYVAGVNKGVVPFVSHIPYQESLPAIEGGQNANSPTIGSTESDDDSGYETASNLSDIPGPFDVDDMERVYRLPDEAQDEGYSESPVNHNHANADIFNDELQQALEQSMVTGITDQLRGADRDREASELSEAIRRSLATATDENDPDLARALALSIETQELDEQMRSARERADVEKATQLSLDSGNVAESDPDMALGIAGSKQTNAVEQEKFIWQEQKAEAILAKYHREFFPTARDGNCFYDGMSRVRRHSSIRELRDRSYQEGIKCLQGDGKLPFDSALTVTFKEQIEQLQKSHNYAEQIDLRLMACTENCRIIVCDLDEKVLNVAGPEGELEQYPKKTLSEVMGQYPEAELFVYDKEAKHYMTGRKK
ncbi:hypothetical protein J7438_12820 [Thalassotalea sp. G20_0]|uniref:OTU domain-containing protein n=1 Tax=Thalassotalea sp. G20_0 TaxID=2821093 RepID=UPI001ADBD770|nr:OTU domain-containing protein [Thalassotalea sp. G20_0]MBO9494960.1 hypothetical protein [Thalassotalea sp. G20_0]